VLARHYTPAPPLGNFVDLLWLYEGYSQPHDKERILPDGSMELVINLSEDRARVYDRNRTNQFQTMRGALLVGAQSNYFVIDTAQQFSVLGVHFKPGGAFPFFRFPAGEFHNQHLSLDLLWGSAATDLRDRLLEAPTPEAKFQILEESLLAHAGKPLSRHPAVNYALQVFSDRHGTPSIADVTGRIGLSSRRFIDVFNDQVGLTPKLFCRVRRFQKVVRSIPTARDIDWTNVALDCGYFDQAHFIHDFRAFSGLSPTAYAAHRTEHVNHVPILD
jgi:AraC-like DNA-binding protein